MTNKEICIELIRILGKIDPLYGDAKMVIKDENVDDQYIVSAILLIKLKGEEPTPDLFLEMATLTYMIDFSEVERLEIIREGKKRE